MAKMKKEAIEALKREDPKENNWEIGENAECGMRNAETEQEPAASAPSPEEFCGPDYKPVEAPEELHEVFAEITDGTVEAEELKRRLYLAWCQVPGEVARFNPVRKFSVRSEPVKIVTFVFRDGRKVRIFD